MKLGLVLFGRTRGIQRNVSRGSVSLHQIVGDQIMFYFLATDIG
jgi:hypothetical protein